MKKNLLLSAVAALLLSAVSAIVYVNNEADAMDDLFNANVEALTRQELDNTHMYLWWINDQGGGAIICTFGGNSPCK